MSKYSQNVGKREKGAPEKITEKRAPETKLFSPPKEIFAISVGPNTGYKKDTERSIAKIKWVGTEPREKIPRSPKIIYDRKRPETRSDSEKASLKISKKKFYDRKRPETKSDPDKPNLKNSKKKCTTANVPKLKHI